LIYLLIDMDYEFLVRTADNVEIILDVSIFWQITDLYKLVLVTQDPPEDICKFNYLIHKFTILNLYMTGVRLIYFDDVCIINNINLTEGPARPS